MVKKAILLVNTGTPKSYAVKDVRSYLREFLSDGRVISIPTPLRYLLVYGIITPFRAFKSARLYKKIWTDKGSPLLYHTQSLAKKLSLTLAEEYIVFYAMRYGEPHLGKVLKQIQEQKIDSLTILPLFPQYASATTGSIAEYVFRFFTKQNTIPDIKLIHSFHNHPAYIQAWKDRISAYDLNQYDHVLFSYHGLPEAHVNATHIPFSCEQMECTSVYKQDNAFCYRAACYHNTRLLADAVGLQGEKYSVCFQSRFSNNWLQPYAAEHITELVQKGHQKVLIVAPSFVADCLETTYELGEEYQQLFFELGGKKWDVVPSLNDDDAWVDALKQIVLNEG